MKKSALIVYVLLLITTSLCAEYEDRVPRTRTIRDSTVLNSIRDACHPNSNHAGYDPVMRQYWCQYINITDTIRSFDESIERAVTFYTDNYVKEAFWGAIGHDTDQHGDENDTPDEILDLARRHLLDPTFIPYYLSLDEVFLYMGSSAADSQFQRGLSLSLILYNVAMMCDMLWWYNNGSYQQDLAAKLDTLAWYTYDTVLPSYQDWFCETTNPADIIPTTGWTNGRLRLLAALGYAGCVLKDVPNFADNAEDYYNEAKEQLFESLDPTTENTFDDDQDGIMSGYMDVCFGDGSGLYKEGFSYYSWSMEFLTTFFTAAKRSGWGDNFYDNDIIVNAVNENIKLHGPDFSGIPMDDCWRSEDDNRYRIAEKLLEFYYQNDNASGLREDLCWYFNAFRTVYNEMPVFDYRREATIMSYNPNRDISSSASIPHYVSEGSYYANPEFTVIRPPMNSATEYNESIGLYVSHENTYSSSHNQDDQTSFSLYANGKYFLIDPGYRAEDKGQWLHSSYAHNLVVVNPDFDNERDKLIWDGFWQGAADSTDIDRKPPYGFMLFWPDTPSDPYYRNLTPAQRTLFIENDNISTANIEMSYCLPAGYDVSNLSSYEVDIERNFFMIDDSYYIIFDKLRNQSNDCNDYRNQLHFAEYNINHDNQSLTYTENGIFTFHDSDLDNNIYVHGVLGAACNFDTYIDEKLPMGWRYSGGSYFRHRRIRAEINNSSSDNEYFLTILISSESSTSPISDTLKGTGYYAVEIYDTSKQPTEKSYYAVSDSLLDVSFTDIDIESDAGFVGLTYRPGYQYDTKITQFIMAEGDSLLYNDTTLVQCSDVDEIIAEYSGTELSVIIKSDDEYPRYKILRQGVDVEDFTSIGVEDGENGTSNIGSIWYDDDYFYVNWNNFFSNTVYLYTSIITSLGHTLVIDNNTTINCMNTAANIRAYEDIEIGNNVTFTSPDSVRWGGLSFYNTSASIEIDSLTFLNGVIESEVDSLIISNSEFTNATLEHYGDKLFLSFSEFDTSHVFCVYTGGGSKEVIPDDVEINISHCTFTHFQNYAIVIYNYDLFDVRYNTISNGHGYGIRLFYSGHPELCNISSNTIENTVGHGIQVYNSYADIIMTNTITGNYYGITASDNSNPSLQGTWFGNTQEIHDNLFEEVVTDLGSFPDIFLANNIYDDNYTLGTQDQYLLRCNDASSVPARSLNVWLNYWGDGCESWTQWDGDDRFSPDTCFCYLPIFASYKGIELSEEQRLYLEADSLFKQKKYKDVENLYRRIINKYPTTQYAEYSIRNLLPLEAATGHDFSSLRNYYLTDPICNISEERTKLCKHLANKCTIELGEYPKAISFFEDIISNPESKQDSIYAVIDAGHTYLLMANDGKSGYVGKMAALKPKSQEDFFITTEKLLSELFRSDGEENNESGIEYAFELKHNYPNPFNNTTKISFSLPANIQKTDLKIYNIKGQLVRKLDIDNTPGIRSMAWDGLDTYGKKVGSGIYFYKLTADKKETIKKMVMIR